MNPLFFNISFFGGIHGVGKSTICKKICTDLNIEYISASEVLKWEELEVEHKRKNVENVINTQNRLIDNLIDIINPNNYYLLDGHYCLLDNANNVEEIPFETFKIINPKSLHIITGDVFEIKSRLENRDNQLYDCDLLDNMQRRELGYAKELSKKLSVILSVGKEDEIGEIIEHLRNIIDRI